MKKRNKKKRRNFKKSNIARRRRRRSQDAYGISFESLEDRKLLAGVTVSTAADFVDGNIATVSSLIASPGPDGAISLREAITAAENTFGTDSINFDAATFNGEAADVIRLQSPLVVFDSIEIDAGDLGVVVSGDSAGNDALVAGSFITDVEASVFAGNFDDNTDSVFVFPGDFQEVTISGLTITSGDSSDSGGGVLVPNSAAVVINESTIAGNRAAVSGGGIQSNNGLLIIQQSSISGNVANNPQIFTGAYGGGINTDSGSLMVYDSTISGNEARGEVSQGGGIRAGGSLSLTNSTVSGNIASTPFPGGAFGGGLFTQSLNVSILNSTITENTADIGGGIANDNALAGGAPLLVDNSIIAGNSAGFDGPDLISSVLVEHDVSFSLIGDNSNSSLEASPSGVADANGNFIGTSNFVIDPQLGELADNGGPTLTHALLATSPANNSGNTTISI